MHAGQRQFKTRSRGKDKFPSQVLNLPVCTCQKSNVGNERGANGCGSWFAVAVQVHVAFL